MQPRPSPPEPFRYSALQPATAPRDDAPYTLLTFHTSGPSGGGYEEEARDWLAAAAQHGYEDRCVVLDAGARSTWRSATFLKPRAILWALETFQRPVCWIDADARIRAPLVVFDRWDGADVGIRIRVAGRRRLSAWCSGTLFFHHTPAAIAMAREWTTGATGAAMGIGEWHDVEGDQEILGFLIRRQRQSLRVHKLPTPYTFVFDRDRRDFPGVEPIVEHLQASRRRHSGQRILGRRCLEPL